MILMDSAGGSWNRQDFMESFGLLWNRKNCNGINKIVIESIRFLWNPYICIQSIRSLWNC